MRIRSLVAAAASAGLVLAVGASAVAAAAVASDPDIASAVVFITSIVDRNVRGQVQVTDSSGVTTAANF